MPRRRFRRSPLPGSRRSCFDPLRPLGPPVQDRLHLVLEASRLDGAMDAALLGGVLLPPPAAGARVLAGLGGAGAGRAADAGKALGVERVERHAVGAVV